MTKEPRWAQVSFATWCNFRVGDRQVRSDTVVGFMRPMAESDLGVSLVRDSRWALGFYRDETAANPFAIVPGCQVRSIQLLDNPVAPGFVEWKPEKSEGDYMEVAL